MPRPPSPRSAAPRARSSLVHAHLIGVALALPALLTCQGTPPPPASAPAPAAAQAPTSAASPDETLTRLAHAHGLLSRDPLAALADRSAITWRHGDLIVFIVRPLTGAAHLIEADLRLPLGEHELTLARTWGPSPDPRPPAPPFAWDLRFGLGPDSPRCASATTTCDPSGRVQTFREHDLTFTVRWDVDRPAQLLHPSGAPLVDFQYAPREPARLVALSARPPGSDAAPRRVASYAYDDAGRLAAATLPGLGITYSYDGELLTSVTRTPTSPAPTSPSTTRLTWDDADRVTALTGPGPLTTTLGYAPTGPTDSTGATSVTVTDPLGDTTRFTWRRLPSHAEVTAIPLARPERARLWRFDPEGRLLAHTDAGQTTTCTWDGPRLASITHPDGLTQRLIRDPDHRLLAVDDGPDHRVTFTLGAHGLLERLTSPTDALTFAWAPLAAGSPHLALSAITRESGHMTRFTRDEHGRPTRVETSAGAREDLAWDPLSGRLATTRDESNAAHALTWDPQSARLLAHRRPDGATAQWRYAPDGRPTLTIAPDGSETRTAYDGPTTTVDGPTGRVVFTTDALGRPLTETSPLGTTRFTWRGPNLVRVDLPDGRHLSRDFDAFGRLTRESTSDGATHTFTWSPPGQGSRLLAETLPDGRTRAYTWSPTGRLTTLREDGPAPGDRRNLSLTPGAASGFTLTDTVTGQAFTYTPGPDGLPRLASAIAPDGTSASFVYDARGRLTEKVSNLGDSFQLTYDPLGRPETLRSAATGTTTFAYDAAGHLVSVRDGVGRTRRYTWDAASRLTSVSDGEHRWLLGHPELGAAHALAPSTLTDPLGRTTRFTWDAKLRLASRTLPWGATERFGYDPLGRLAETNGPAGRRTFTWDDRGRLTRLAVDGEPVLALSFDDRGRVTREEGPDLTRTSTFEDSDGGQTRTTRAEATGRAAPRTPAPSAHTTARVRDQAGRLARIELDGAPLATYRRDEAHRLARVEGPDGFAAEILRDPFGRRAGLRLHAGGQVSYRFDAARRLVGLEVRAKDGATWSAAFTYDEAGRLTATRAGDQTQRYTFAPTGRLTSAHLEARGRPETYRWSRAGELIGRGDQELPHDAHGRPTLAGRTWDAAGRLSSVEPPAPSSPTTFSYDRAGRLARVRSADTDLSYAYDASGRLVSRSAPGRAELRWLHDGDDLLLSQAGSAATRHIPDERPGARLGFVGDSGPRYLVTAPDGSTLAVLDGEGRVRATHLFDPWAHPLVATGDSPDPLAYRGRFRDPDSGLIHYPMRWYDPETATFIAPDPEAGDAMEPTSLPPWAYLALDPVNHVDALGAQAHEWGAETCLEAVCRLFQSGKIEAVWSVRGDDWTYLGALEKRGWTYDIWARPVPGSDRVVTVFRDLNERAEGFYGGGANIGKNIVLNPDGPRHINLPNSIRAASPAAPTTPAVSATPATSVAPQAARPGLLGRVGASLREGANNVKLGVQLYGREVGGTVATLGGLSGTLGTSVGTIAALPGGGLIIAGAVAVAGALGYGVGTAVNHIPGVPEAVQGFFSGLFGYQQDQTIANLEAETRNEGRRTRARRERAIRESLERDPLPPPSEPGVAGGTVGLDGPGVTPPPGEDDDEDDQGDEPSDDQPGGEDGPAPTPPAEPSILDKVAAKKVTVVFTHSTDASSGGFANVVECTETLTFWNVGALAPGYETVTLRGRCVASINGSVSESGGSGTFSGGPNGTITFADEDGAIHVKLRDGKTLELPDIGPRPVPAEAFADWPADLW